VKPSNSKLMSIERRFLITIPGSQLVFRFLVLILVSLVLAGCETNDSSEASTEAGFKQVLKRHHFEIFENAIKVNDFEFMLASGQKESFSENKGKVILLNFWATWCFPCKQEMPDLEELTHEMKGDKFRILAVNSGEEPGKINRFLKKYPYSFDVVLDHDRRLTHLMKIDGLPTTYLLNPDLEIIGRVIGVIDWKDERFINYLRRYSRL
jgi:thiol-disulfide isomerase/thioredoxin